MRGFSSLVCLLLTSCAVARESVSPVSFIPASVSVARFQDADSGEAAEAGTAGRVEYGALFRRAVHDPRSLRRFVQLATDRHFDGAALETHLYHVRELLVWWGDRPFSVALARITAEERRILRPALRRQELLQRGFASTARLLYPPNEPSPGAAANSESIRSR